MDRHAANVHCSLCRLVVHCLREAYGEAPTDTFWQDGQISGQKVKCFIEQFLPKGHDWKGSMSFGYLLITTEPPLKDLIDGPQLPNRTILHQPRVVLLAEGCLEARHAFGGVKRRKLWPEVDPSLAGLWIKFCQEAHLFKRPHEQLPEVIRLIDIENGCLVDSPSPDCEYYALSYVWGGPQKFSLTTATKVEFQQPGSLLPTNTNIPWTIRDFLTIVAALGGRYAWVDSLCIIQDDPNNIRLIVQAMDIIYENATITIVAASGTSAHDGIPGVRPGTRRSMQGREVIHRQALGVPLPPLDEAIDSSTWNSRGWTYQESILSRRMLVFTDSQMHYKCINGCTACEETCEDAYKDANKDAKPQQIASRSELHSYEPKMLVKTVSTDPHHGIHNSIGWWVHHVREICRRKTTEPKDRLHALDGILQHLRSLFDNHEFVWGMPTSALDVALLRRPFGESSSSIRSPAIDNSGVVIPSWSWAGWTGEIHYRVWNLCETAHSLVSWIDVTNKNEPASERQFKASTCGAPTHAWLNENGWRRQKGEDSVGAYYLKGDSSKIRYAHPHTFGPDEGPIRAVDKNTGELNFFAQTAEFAIPKKHIEERAGVISELDENSNIRHLCLFDKEGHVAGVVLADPDVLKSLNQENFECVAIVNTTLTRVEWDQCYDDEEQRFKHLTEYPRVKRVPGENTKWKPQTVDKEEHWDFYESCWHPTKTITTCPFHDTKGYDESFCVSPFRSIHPMAGPFPFDPRYYSIWRPWPLNEVLLIERRGDIAFRIGVGYVNYGAWTPVTTEKHIRLR